MAGNGMNVLPQFQGNYYDLQTKQALAQALMQQSLTPQATPQTVGSGGSQNYQVVPKQSIGAGIAQLGQALVASKLQQQTSQGLGQFGQAQMNYLTGSGQPQPQAQPQASGVGGSPDGTQQSGSVPNPFQPNPQALAGALGASSGATPAPQQAQQPQQSQSGGLLAPGSAMNPSGMDVSKAAFLYQTMGPEAYAKEFVAPYVKPTDATLMGRQAGLSPQQVQSANAGALTKANFIAPITGTGTFRDPVTMKPVAFNPDIPAGTTPLYDASGNVAKVQPIAGAQGAMQGNAAATAAGGAQFKPVQVYNPKTQQMEYSNEAAVTNPPSGGGAAPTLSGIFAQQESSGGKTAPDNPMQIQQGTFKQFAQPGESWSNPADKTAVANRVLTTYQQKYGGDLGRIATAYFSGEGNVAPAGSPTPFIKNVSDSNGKSVASYVGDIYARGAGMPKGGSGAPAAAPPLGAQATVEANAKGQVDTMQKSYQNLQTVRSGAPAALQDLGNMQNLASGKSTAIVGPAMASLAGLVSPNAAEYEKSRDNLVTNLGSQLGINSDAAREMVYGSIPSYGAPKQAIANGLQTLQGQVQTRLLKAGYLTDAYTAGDAKAYNQKENQFDQNITPAIANVVTMPPGPQRSAALQTAAKDPQVRARLEWAAQNGVLK